MALRRFPDGLGIDAINARNRGTTSSAAVSGVLDQPVTGVVVAYRLHASHLRFGCWRSTTAAPGCLVRSRRVGFLYPLVFGIRKQRNATSNAFFRGH